MEKRAEGLIQSGVGLCVKTNDDTTVNNAVAEVPNKWLKLIDANGKMKKAKRFVFKEFRILSRVLEPHNFIRLRLRNRLRLRPNHVAPGLAPAPAPEISTAPTPGTAPAPTKKNGSGAAELEPQLWLRSRIKRANFGKFK